LAAVDYSILFKFITDSDQNKVRCQKVKVTAWKQRLIGNMLLSYAKSGSLKLMAMYEFRSETRK